ncbi:NAD(P)H-hydrate dehydratase [Ramlibacter sp. G-1-2-2]|uniref:ADP-dependent (S)-NAD(P)H-hydrate dehydratase n=1 Tax=Ramlibacter agri TaxID=2728837 RepID=A0A848HGT1_9BURK|nr:NAD(P)H-hydrate dehydratase [Ramlibacter agri]NML48639.1 NAD(P)H-hydrate dehydratase [Ramlibacter agri]
MTAREVDEALLRGWPLPAVDGDGDKESRGSVLVVAGSREVPGAAVLAAEAALRAGAGKLVVATPESAWALVAAALPEARVVPLAETSSGGPQPGSFRALASCAADTAAVLVGPGMADTLATAMFVQDLLALFAGSTFVLDALAMDCVRNGLRFRQPVLLTPHAGEMAHLTGGDKQEIHERPMEVAARQAAAWNAVVALKGATTCIASPDARAWRHSAETPGLATSGSGDVLAGLVAGLAARGAPPEQAAVWGVALHARAGAALGARIGAVGYLARDLAAEVPALMQALS